MATSKKMCLSWNHPIERILNCIKLWSYTCSSTIVCQNLCHPRVVPHLAYLPWKQSLEPLDLVVKHSYLAFCFSFSCPSSVPPIFLVPFFKLFSFQEKQKYKLQRRKWKKRWVSWHYIIAMIRRTFLGSIREDLWCRGRDSRTSSAFDASFREGAVTGKVGSAEDQKGSNALRNLWWKGPAIEIPISLNSNFAFNQQSCKKWQQKHALNKIK